MSEVKNEVKSSVLTKLLNCLKHGSNGVWQ